MPKDKRWALFAAIEAMQEEAAFGRVLDAGTGPRSLGWLKTLETEAITAVTGDPLMKRQVERIVGEWQRAQDRLVVGNWTDAELLAGERFDIVLADYLLGSIEGFAPYFQDRLFERLRPLTAGRLYLTGVEPYVVDRPRDEGAALIWRIGRYRDACLMLLGKKPYREYPLDWVLAQLARSGFAVTATRKFPASYSTKFVNGQIDLPRPGLEKMGDRALADALIARGEALRARAVTHIERHGPLKGGFSYLVAADPA